MKMKFLGKRGQGAMEYLMTYGWAILVVMIVGVVLWQLGIFGPGPGGANTASGFTKIKPMEPSIVYSAAADTLNFTVVCAAGTGISITNVNLTDGDHGCTGTITVDGTTMPAPAGVTKDAGETAVISIASCTKDEKDPFNANIRFTYTQSVGGTVVTHTDTGIIRGTVEA